MVAPTENTAAGNRYTKPFFQCLCTDLLLNASTFPLGNTPEHLPRVRQSTRLNRWLCCLHTLCSLRPKVSPVVLAGYTEMALKMKNKTEQENELTQDRTRKVFREPVEQKPLFVHVPGRVSGFSTICTGETQHGTCRPGDLLLCFSQGFSTE